MPPIIPLWMKPVYSPIRGRQEKVVRCPYCSAEVFHEMKICPKCGKNLVDPEVKTGQPSVREYMD